MAAEETSPPKSEVVAGALLEHADKLRGLVRARVPEPLVDDVLQSAAMRAVERSESLRDPERVLPWLYRIHRNAVADAWRNHQGAEQLMEGADESKLPAETPTTAIDSPCQCSLAQAQRLRPAYASVLNLVDAGDASIAEAAEILGISTNNATVRLHRARRALRSSLLEHCGVQSFRDCADCRCGHDGCCAA